MTGQIQGGPSGQRLYFDDFDWVVPPCCLHAMPILPNSTKSKSTKWSRRPDGSPSKYVSSAELQTSNVEGGEEGSSTSRPAAYQAISRGQDQ